ncbi:hypothetical protein AMI01nite_45150 [Aneurinibacillus migulanus]|nr:hypothetical protein AMI01nite_45150 [Aneurinibacillus migulanus]
MANKSPNGFRWKFEVPLKLMRKIPVIAITNPMKKLIRNGSSFKNRYVRITVKNGTTELIIPTLEAIVKVKAMFSKR